MGALVTAYAAVWLGVTLYVAWLGVRQRRLIERLQAVQAQLSQSNRAHDERSRAA